MFNTSCPNQNQTPLSQFIAKSSQEIHRTLRKDLRVSAVVADLWPVSLPELLSFTTNRTFRTLSVYRLVLILVDRGKILTKSVSRSLRSRRIWYVRI